MRARAKKGSWNGGGRGGREGEGERKEQQTAMRRATHLAPPQSVPETRGCIESTFLHCDCVA